MRPGYSSWSLMIPNRLKNRYKFLIMSEKMTTGFFTKHMRKEFMRKINEVEKKSRLQLTIVDMSEVDGLDDPAPTTINDEVNTTSSFKEKLTYEEMGESESETPSQTASETSELDGSTTEQH